MDKIARLYGEEITDLPPDLYIPPDALAVILSAFEGPLDLLLYLIRRHSIDILDIPMAELTRQYLAYIAEVKKHELAAEYLLMAAVLIEIKSRMLLPKPADVGEEEDPRAELVRRLIEYEKIKRAAGSINEMEQEGRDFSIAQALFERIEGLCLPEVTAFDLQNAWAGILKKARLVRHHKIGREELSVREHMSRILKALAHGEYVAFDSLFELGLGLAHLIVTFLAMLELVRENLISVMQNDQFSDIYLKVQHEA